MEVIQVQVGEGKQVLAAAVVPTGDGIAVYLGGGEKFHIGTTVVCQPRPSLKQDGSMSTTSSVINLLGHKDDGLAEPLACRLCLATGQTVVVIAGVHVDQADQEDIQVFFRNLDLLTAKLLTQLGFD